MSESSWTEWSQNVISTLQDSVTSFLVSTENRADALRAYIAEHPSASFRDNPWALMAAIEDFATTKSHMMIFRESKMRIARAALEAMPVKPKVILEFGTYVGNSALAWGAILQSLHGADAAAQGCRVYTFEIDPGMVRVAREFIQLAGLDDVVHVLEGPAAESVKRLYEEGKIARGGVDMVFFDHWEKYYLPDLLLCEDLRVLREGSLVIADNTDMPGAPQYLKHVRSGGGGVLGMVRYESKAFESTTQIGVPNIVEISTVVET
ncbi:S-adenosyl-L-methionine-dependent methyltransferase [Aspergillus sclerotioniger CBS 115572]|uniref:catechol O-methyltransferase n=1 Tax=Aspergillus sclerotioniger CBS 115572 TaxID=1450535 RepID=A0A317W8Q0_9EURO|nr:S-adenosyl-L-methionine-dependent methyltransferase [Aspergillus sclerotioniger CBS 115572]PWY81622.1 S-adenosyl-L-methionine-dependent methyltransferase [Aspergillus sclerotioniger CBS 115572]